MKEHSSQLDFLDGRKMALLIDGTFANKRLRVQSIGVTWRPSGEGRGRGPWPEKKCRAVVRMLVDYGLAVIEEGWFGQEVMLTEYGREYFNLGLARG